MLVVSGKYRLEQRLGGGGMAEVFLGASLGAEGFQRRVAIKRVLPGYSDNPAFAQMFIEEAKLSSQLVHPNIVSVLDFDRDSDGRLFLVMELVDGRDLDALVSTGPVPIPVVIHVVTEVLRGLGYAHDLPVGAGIRGIVHRDVSPHNVLISWEGAVKVSDFGIAKARSASNATASEFIKGKPAYMSPEQANGQKLDGRSDLFAVGVMLWEMLCGRRLFVAEDTRATLAAVLFGQIPRPRSLRSDIPKDLERVVMKLLEREAPNRYATAEEAIAALHACADAPKAGRELLIATLTERFPGARVRQSRASGQPLPTPAPYARHDGYGAPHGAESLSHLRNAETRVQRSRGKLLGILAIALVGSAAAAFGIAKAVSKKPAGSDAGSTSVAAGQPPPVMVDAPAPDAAPLPQPPPPPPPDAATVVVDAGTPPVDAKKDAPVTTPSQAEKRYGTLEVVADPTLTVYVDKKRIGDTPVSVKLLVGKHAVLLTGEGIRDERLTATISETKPYKIDRIK